MPSINSYRKSNIVAMKGLDLLLNDLSIGRYFSDEYSGEYAKKYAIGANLTVPMSQRWTVQRNDMTFNAQAMDRPVTTITVDQTATIPMEWESIEKALDMERGEDRVEELYIKPAIKYIRQAVEVDFAQYAAQNANMLLGVLGTNPTTYDATSAAALQALSEMSCPDDELGLFIPPSVNRAIKTTNLNQFNPTVDISKQNRYGYVGKNDSFDWYRSMSLYRHTAGTWAGAVTVNGAGQSGSSINVTCTTGDTFFKGDKISFANTNQVNLMTRIATSTATAGTKVFSITAPTVGVANAATLQIYPPMYAPGSHYQNVDALPATGAALTLWPGTASPSGKIGYLGLALYPGAFFSVGMKLEEPEAVEFCSQYQDPKTGLAIRCIRQWDNRISAMTTRLDCLWGRGLGLAEQGAVVIACA
jgi:hypothetical protein